MEIMFKKTLLALAITGVSVAANAAVVKTSVTATTAVLQQTAIGTAKAHAKGTALGASGVFGTAADATNSANCKALAAFYGVSLTKADGTAAHAVAADGSGGDVATFADGSGRELTTVHTTAANACLATVKPVLSTTAAKDGLEYTQATALEIKPVIVAGIGGYKAEDTLTFQFSGAKLDLTKTTAPSITVAAAGQAGAGVTFDILDITDSQIRFTVKATTPANDFVRGNGILELSNIFLDSTGLAATTSVMVNSFGTNTSGTKFDESTAATIVSLLPQYTTEVTTLLDADIDVGKDRQQFANNLTADVLAVKHTKNPTSANVLVPANTTYVVTGDFSWAYAPSVDTNKDGKLSSAELMAANVAVLAGGDDTVKSLALNATNTELTIVTNIVGAALDATNTITFNVPGYDSGKGTNPMISVQDFTVKVDTMSDKSVGSKAVNMPSLAKTAAGTWKLNGSVVVVPYVPFGPATQPILRHTNAGTQTGDITVRYMVEGVHTAWQSLAAAGIKDAKPGVRDMLGLVTDALKGEGYDSTTTGFKVALEVVTNVPSKDVFVYGGAKITAEGQDRIHLGTFKTNVN
ncbi:hypothetical protein PTD2_07619 [Pseudoalteromonas tunicata D2]|uniref:EF-hand domain-containing protein n=2 Tax=Pseudoalteromonas tunicata TaxID=314281 RepID=A4C8H9_9GAMM|nr:hypothetical protein PTD2_07619 [Pseudoalteromonas tunicata D2]